MPSASNKRNTDPLFDALNPEHMISNANKVLSAAVNVLEEEIAAGILAAKKFETKIIDVEDIREDPQDLMNRIRRDVHEAVDLLMDSLTAITRQLGVLSQPANGKAGAPQTKDGPARNDIPVIKNLKPAVAGEVVLLKLLLSNSQSQRAVKIQMQKVDLNGPQSFKIPLKNITVKPSVLTLLPDEKKELHIRVKLPANLGAGQYSGLFVDANDSANKAIIHIDVI